MDGFAFVRRALPTPRKGDEDVDLDVENPSEQLLYGEKLNAKAEIRSQDESQLNVNGRRSEPDRRSAFSTFSRRIGFRSLATSILSIIALLATISFLGWLWRYDGSSNIWRRIVFRDLLKQAVTLSSLLIRVAVSALATVATSMIASIAIERRGVPLQVSAQVSLARFSNSGPKTFWKSVIKKKFFRGSPLRLLIAALLTTTIATQFSSTLLLSDLGQGPVVSFPAGGFRASGMTYSSLNRDGGPNPNSPLFFDDNYWVYAPTTFETFAEFSKPSNSSDGIDDTGVTLRSFLPIGDQKTREDLRSYNGSASVFDSRVVCVRPNITDLKFCGKNPITLCGNFTTDTLASDPASGLVPGLVARNGSVGFSCKMSSQSNQSKDTRGAAWLLCFLDYIAGGLTSALDPTAKKGLNWTWDPTHIPPKSVTSRIYRNGSWVAHNGDSFWYIDLGQAYVIMNASEPDAGAGMLNWTSEASGPWTQVKYSTNSSEEYFRMSICYDSLPIPASMDSIQEFNMTAASLRSRQEPIGVWDANTTKLDTTAIRNQLGVRKGGLTAEERGILNLTSADAIFQKILQIGSTWEIPQTPLNTTVFNTSTYPWVIPMILNDLSSVALCPKCSHGGTHQASNVLISLFKDILTETDSPALALQAILTTVLRMAYYDWVPLFNANSSYSTTSIQQALIPLHYRGLLAVISIVAAHLILCLLTTLAFIIYSRQTLLGNSWQTISQLSNRPELNEILKRAHTATDSEIRKSIGKRDKLEPPFRVGSVTGENADFW